MTQQNLFSGNERKRAVKEAISYNLCGFGMRQITLHGIEHLPCCKN